MPITSHPYLIEPSNQKSDRIVGTRDMNHRIYTTSFKYQEDRIVMSPFPARNNFMTLNIQTPSHPSPSAVDNESTVVHPITPIFQPAKQATTAFTDCRVYDNDADHKEEDTLDAALLLTNVGMLMAKEVRYSLLKENNAPVVPDLYNLSPRSCSRSNSIPSSCPITLTRKRDERDLIDMNHICPVFEKIHHKKHVEGVIQILQGEVKENVKKEGKDIGSDMGMSLVNLSSQSTRARTVSMDSHIHFPDSSGPLKTSTTLFHDQNVHHHQDIERYPICIAQQTNGSTMTTALPTPQVSPPTSPILRSVSQDEDFPMIPMVMKEEKVARKSTSARHVDRRKRYLDSSLSSEEEKDCHNNNSNKLVGSRRRNQDGRFAQDNDTPRLLNYRNHNNKKSNTSLKFILRKKFSWKNYPVLEAFLVANRGEYLRHSALNYTMQQKNYNNRLTERLLEIASENGYIFDEDVFSFVTVRDRIRCYFKSYVQSRKKRGVIIGYAARRAGLMSEKEIEASACRKGKIVVPQCFATQQQQK